MATHNVEIDHDKTKPNNFPHKKAKVKPGGVYQERASAGGKTIKFDVKNFSRAFLVFPNADKLFVGASQDLVVNLAAGTVTYTFVANPSAGTYQYAVYWEDMNGVGQFAEGSSPPEIIIY